jgi:hypothetical protein
MAIVILCLGVVAMTVVAIALNWYWTAVAGPRLRQADIASGEGDQIPGIAWMLTHGLIVVILAIVELALLFSLANVINSI